MFYSTSTINFLFFSPAQSLEKNSISQFVKKNILRRHKVSNLFRLCSYIDTTLLLPNFKLSLKVSLKMNSYYFICNFV